MSPQIREQLANLCYAGVLAVIGGALLAISAGNEGAATDYVGGVGGLCLFAALLYAVFGLFRLAAILRQPGEGA